MPKQITTEGGTTVSVGDIWKDPWLNEYVVEYLVFENSVWYVCFYRKGSKAAGTAIKKQPVMWFIETYDLKRRGMDNTEDAGYHIKLHGAYLSILPNKSIIPWDKPCASTRHGDTDAAKQAFTLLPDVWRSEAYIVHVEVVTERREKRINT